MIKLEAQELRGVPIIKLDFHPQSEQFSKLGRALTAFVQCAEETFSDFDGEMTIGWKERSEPVPVAIEETKKPIAEYKNVQLHQELVLPAEDKKIVDIVNVKLAEEPLPEAVRVKKKKVETKLSSI